MTGPIMRVRCERCGGIFARRRDGTPYMHHCTDGSWRPAPRARCTSCGAYVARKRQPPRTLTPLPPDVRALIVDGLAKALVADYRRRHADRETASQSSQRTDVVEPEWTRCQKCSALTRL
jgi:hypothetical protein